MWIEVVHEHIKKTLGEVNLRMNVEQMKKGSLVNSCIKMERKSIS